MKKIVAVLALALTAGCYEVNQAEQQQMEATRQLQEEAQAQVGMPDLLNWTERRLMKDILELRDDPSLSTYTYIVTFDGTLLPLCQSRGYGLPYSVQYTNPMAVKAIDPPGNGSARVLEVLPQPDPNGLYMPEGLSATWVLCLNPETGRPDPIYVEPTIVVTPFELSLEGWGN